ncbi:hypothetical protein CEXT_520111 [Caerostris extrusa]|uniref:Uncharacterized protein n=1 Tax=Caerostris extrusa TaxID=172846 RepID=A0AAV4N6N4_CAEEX|nr:hypothetical protein CEXT_520111 [Caerostris extrusa]
MRRRASNGHYLGKVDAIIRGMDWETHNSRHANSWGMVLDGGRYMIQLCSGGCNLLGTGLHRIRRINYVKHRLFNKVFTATCSINFTFIELFLRWSDFYCLMSTLKYAWFMLFYLRAENGIRRRV